MEKIKCRKMGCIKIISVLKKIYVYARMRRDEDNSRSQYQAMTDKCHYVMAQVSAAESYFEPELLEAPEEKIMAFIEENEELKNKLNDKE